MSRISRRRALGAIARTRVHVHVGRSLALAGLVVSGLVGCGVPTTAEPVPLPTDLTELAPSPQPDVPAAQLRPTDLVWVRGQRLVLAARPVPASDVATQGASAIAALVAGPTPQELARGLSSEVPPDLEASLTVQGRTATIDLRGPDVAGAGNARLATAQLAISALLVPGIDTVRFTVEGAPAEVPLGDGTVGSGRLSLADFAPVLGRRVAG